LQAGTKPEKNIDIGILEVSINFLLVFMLLQQERIHLGDWTRKPPKYAHAWRGIIRINDRTKERM